MSGSLLEFNKVRIFLVAAADPQLRSDRDAVDLMSAASEYQADFIAIPVERLGDDFFDLKTRIAGEILQKFVMYGKRVAIVGDIADRIAASKSLAAFVLESNRGPHIWFVASVQELAQRLDEQGAPKPSSLGNRPEA